MGFETYAASGGKKLNPAVLLNVIIKVIKMEPGYETRYNSNLRYQKTGLIWWSYRIISRKVLIRILLRVRVQFQDTRFIVMFSGVLPFFLG